MKSTFTFLILAVSLNTFAADQVRNETRSRIVGEKLVQVAKCGEIQTRSYDSQDSYIDNNNKLQTRKIIVVRSSASLTLTKCQEQQEYMAQVTGSGWFAKESEIPGSAKSRSVLINQSQSIVKTQDIPNEDGSSSASLVLTIAEGLKAQVQKECQKLSKDLRDTISESKENCR
jgi:hypothetical protein